MAERICFIVSNTNEVIETPVSFTYINGLAFSQRVKCASSLANSIKEKYKGLKHLEVSTKSLNPLGVNLSAFNLKLGEHYVESIFQSSKVFESDIQYDFLIDYQPKDAKRYIKEHSDKKLIKFRYKNNDYPLDPKSAFYDWIYINALDKSIYVKEVLDYDIFTDIEFNDKKSINCQARAVAIYVSMNRLGKKDYYLSSFNNFISFYR